MLKMLLIFYHLQINKQEFANFYNFFFLKILADMSAVTIEYNSVIILVKMKHYQCHLITKEENIFAHQIIFLNILLNKISFLKKKKIRMVSWFWDFLIFNQFTSLKAFLCKKDLIFWRLKILKKTFFSFRRNQNFCLLITFIFVFVVT